MNPSEPRKEATARETAADPAGGGTARAALLLLLSAAIWGFAFPAQRAGMEHVGPFTFNAVRFLIGGAVLLPAAALLRLKAGGKAAPLGRSVAGGFWIGAVLFFGSAFQQTGLVYTTAGKAGFITGLYVVLVPLAAALTGKKIRASTWAGAALALGGMYLLSVKSGFSVGKGDLLVLAGTLFWTVHVLSVDRFSKSMDIMVLSAVQVVFCSAMSFAAALAAESISLAPLEDAAVPILYAALFSTCIAYTLQIAGQKRSKPAHAAIILSMEAVFAAFGGWLLLGEILSPADYIGCGLMLAGMLLA